MNRYNMTTIQSMPSFTVIITIALLYIVVGNDVNAATIINNNQHHRRHTRWYELSNNYTFDKYVVEYEKVYIDTEEFVQREKNFNKNLKYIMEHNEIPNVSYHMGVNIFTDWSQEEFYERRLRRGKKRHYNGFRNNFVNAYTNFSLSSSSKRTNIGNAPDSVDWRTKKNVLTPVKDQGDCGSCWAFSVAETIESRAALASDEKKLVELSAQQITACTPNPEHCGGTGNCDGATEALGYDYLATVGLTSEKDYPYKSKNGKDKTCRPKKIIPAATVKGHIALPANEYKPLIEAVLQGPLSVAVAVSDDFEFYESGIFSCNIHAKKKKKAKQCWEINHAVQLVGYGANEKNASNMYWIVRNSWGADWGENGYIRLARYGEGKEPCGEDLKTKDGSACGPPYPKSEHVCGESGILSESTFPIDPEYRK